MAILQIDLFDQTNDRRMWVSLRDNLPVLDLIQKLVSDLELKQGEYELIDEDSGRKLSEEATLREEGIKEEQLLRLRKKKKAPLILPIPIVPPSKVSAETQAPSDTKASASAEPEIPAEKTGPESAQSPKAEVEESHARGRKAAPARKLAGGKLPPPPPKGHRHAPPHRGFPGNFWHQPLFQPRFLRWIPFSIWVYTKPILILVLILIMVICCLAGMCTCRVTGFGAKCPPMKPGPAAMITVTPQRKSINSPLDAPYTFVNNKAYNQYTAGKIDKGSRSLPNNMDYNQIFSDFSQKKVIEVSGSCASRPDGVLKMVLVAANEGGIPVTHEHYAWFKDSADGGDYLLRIDPENHRMMINLAGSSGAEQWEEFIPKEITVYRPTEKQCWEYSTFLAFNIDQPPFDNLDLRRALIYSFDSAAYYEQVFAKNEGMTPATGLVPQAVLNEEVSPEFVSYQVPFDIEHGQSLLDVIKKGGWLGDYTELDDLLHPTYCNACEGMDVETDLIVKMWRNNLGVGGKAIPENYDTHWKPIKGTQRQMYNMTYGHSNYYSFMYGVLNEGWIMLPASGQAKALSLLEQYANETDPVIRQDLIYKIDYLILEEYAVALPLYYFSSCE